MKGRSTEEADGGGSGRDNWAVEEGRGGKVPEVLHPDWVIFGDMICEQ